MSRVGGTGHQLATTLRVLRAVLRNPSLRRVQFAFLLFIAAMFGTWVAILVYAYGASGPGSVGVVALVQLLPAAAFAPVSASLADRYPRERVLLAGYSWQAVASSATAAGMLFGAPPALVYACAAVAAAGTTFTRPAQGALLPALSRTPDELTAANSITGTVEGAGVLLGPLVAAAILAVSTPAAVWVAGSLACVLAALLVTNLARGSVRTAPSAGDHGDASGRDLLQKEESVAALVIGGLRVLAANGSTRLIVALLGVRMLTVGAMDVLFVLLSLEVFDTGASGAGILTAALGLGTVLGGAASLSLVGRRRLAPAMAVSALVWGLSIALMGTLAPASLAPAMIALGGIGLAATDVAARTVLQRVTPDRMLARVLGALEGIGLFFLALGSVLVPLLAAWLGIQAALVIIAFLLPISVAVTWLPLRHIDNRVHIPVRELALLRRTQVFAPLPAPQLESVARRTRWVTVRTGDVLIREGDQGDHYYILESGRLRVTKGGEFLRNTDGPGEGLGEIALLHGVRRTASVTAVEPCVLLTLERAGFLEAVTGHEVAHGLATQVAAGRAMTPPPEGRGPS
ncbi:MAG: MFS transporter [Chloroflexi bacterium]|nr:MFS transporter [Chloroflexota bacterium]